MDNEYKPTYDIFALHEHNSMKHHIAIALAWYIISWPIFLLVWILWRLIAGEEFTKRPFRTQMSNVGHLSGCVHHSIVTYYGLKTIMRCGAWPLLMMDDSCWDNYRPEYSLTSMISSGFFAFDLTVYLLLSRDFSQLGMQSILHHVIGSFSYIGMLFAGTDLPMIH